MLRFVSFQNHRLTWCYVPPTVRRGVSWYVQFHPKWCPFGVHFDQLVSRWCPSVSTRRHAMTNVEPVRWCRRHDCPQLEGSGNTRRKLLKLWHDQHGAIQHESFVVQVGTVWVGISHFDPNYVVDVFGTVCDVRC